MKTRLFRHALVAAAALVVGTTSVPAHAAVPACSAPVLVAAQVTPHPLDLDYDMIDVASATAACIDLAGVPHIVALVFEWYYTGGAMPACPSVQESVATPNVAGLIAVQGVATCQRPSSSPAWEDPGRYVCVQLWVDGFTYGAAQCAGILLNPTPVL